MPKLDEEKIRSIKELTNIILKIILVASSLVAFFIILYFKINATPTIGKAQGVCLEACISGTLFMIIRHFFPKTSPSSSNGQSGS